MFATHELLEAAQSAREEAEGFTFPSHDVHLANAQVMRTEYVVERPRLEISGALRWVCGRDGQVVQQLLRHSSQQVTTEIYMHLFPEDLDRLRDSLDRVYAEASSDDDIEEAKEAGGGNGRIVPLSARRESRATN